MTVPRLWVNGFVWMALSLAMGCGIRSSVDSPGGYRFVADGEVSDSDLYALAYLLVVEEDGISGKTMAHFFEGDLSSASVGIEDLRRIELRHGRRRFLFRSPESAYMNDIEGETRSDLRLDVGGEVLGNFARVDNESAAPTATNRYLAYPDNYDVRAYRLVADGVGWRERLQLQSGAVSIAIDPNLSSLEAVMSFVEEGLVVVPARESPGDYVEVSFFQEAIREEDGAPIELSLIYTRRPGESDVLNAELAKLGGEVACWLPDKPLDIRLEQVVRRIGGEAPERWAVVHRKIEKYTVEAARWGLLVPAIEPRDYCADYR